MQTLKLEILSEKYILHTGNQTQDHYIQVVHLYMRCMPYQFNYMDPESDTTAKPYIDHSSLIAHILFSTKAFHTTSLKFSELISGTDSFTHTHPLTELMFIITQIQIQTMTDRKAIVYDINICTVVSKYCYLS